MTGHMGAHRRPDDTAAAAAPTTDSASLFDGGSGTYPGFSVSSIGRLRSLTGSSQSPVVVLTSPRLVVDDDGTIFRVAIEADLGGDVEEDGSISFEVESRSARSPPTGRQ